MEHAHAHGAHDAVFDTRDIGPAPLLQRAAAAVKQVFQPAPRPQLPARALAAAPRRCPDPYFDVWLEKRLHGTD